MSITATKQFSCMPCKPASRLVSPHNRVSHELNVFINGQRRKHDLSPVYRGVTLDRTLSYKDHISKTADALKSRNHLISKLTGTTWGANASTLQTSALALCYSVAEYCCPVWAWSGYAILPTKQHHVPDHRMPVSYLDCLVASLGQHCTHRSLPQGCLR